MTVYDTSFGIDLLHKIAGGKTPSQLQNALPREKINTQFSDL